MKRAVWFAGLGLVLVAFSCDPALSLQDALAGKHCGGAEPKCLSGYVCDEERCVLPKDVRSPEAGAAGAGSMTMFPPQADTGGAGGTETIEAGVDTMSSDVPDASAATPPCTPVTLFVDRDEDGFGSDLEPTIFRCPSEGYATRGGDCFDAEVTADNHAAEVHEGQLGFFDVGYPRPDQPGEVSFDYDCSGEEESAAGNRAVATADCDSAFPACNAGTGVLATERSGPGINALCGSQTIGICDLAVGACLFRQEPAGRAFLCH